ncbi:AraC family transcriptional regulator [Cellvibrio mixtus]|uniref:AraC family transcriptional regulator n=1 Tax=Cellvibrio mixtus TaxID=39650 RepID=UPI0005864EA3|nr:helix-turn-helix domain-containing protein [Cellvibrio mixtus]
MEQFSAVATVLTQWSIGFSMFAIVLLWMVYWWVFKPFDNTWLSRIACAVMLVTLAGLQVYHWQALNSTDPLFEARGYLAFLFIAAPSFYLFSRELLQFNSRNHPLLILHFLPLAVSPLLAGVIAIPLAFCIGTGYALWLCLALFRLRDQRKYFQLELLTFSVFALIALIILLSGLLAPWLGEGVYIHTYANLISLALFAVLYLQLRFPDINQKTCDAVAATYAASTLKNTDCVALVERLNNLLLNEKIYRDENLSLAGLAELLELSSHQTSELINTHFNLGFSRLIRQYRINEARQQLVDEPRSSVLSIGLAVGFSSQSNFYTAFRELTGETPGQFRKRMGVSET